MFWERLYIWIEDTRVEKAKIVELSRTVLVLSKVPWVSTNSIATCLYVKFVSYKLNNIIGTLTIVFEKNIRYKNLTDLHWINQKHWWLSIVVHTMMYTVVVVNLISSMSMVCLLYFMLSVFLHHNFLTFMVMCDWIWDSIIINLISRWKRGDKGFRPHQDAHSCRFDTAAPYETRKGFAVLSQPRAIFTSRRLKNINVILLIL